LREMQKSGSHNGASFFTIRQEVPLDVAWSRKMAGGKKSGYASEGYYYYHGSTLLLEYILLQLATVVVVVRY